MIYKNHVKSDVMSLSRFGESGGMGKSSDKPTILIVEDDPFIAMDLEFAFEDAGLTVVGPVDDVSSALAALAAHDIDCACLDYNLGKETSLPIAEVLGEKGVPFVFATGHPGAIASDLGIEPGRVLPKPVDPSTILKTLTRLGCGEGA